MNIFLHALKEVRAMATRGVPNCVNLECIDRIVKKHGIDLLAPEPTPAEPAAAGQPKPQFTAVSPDDWPQAWQRFHYLSNLDAPTAEEEYEVRKLQDALLEEGLIRYAATASQ